MLNIYPSRPKLGGLTGEARRMQRVEVLAWDMVKLISDKPEARDIREAANLVKLTHRIIRMRVRAWESVNCKDGVCDKRDLEHYTERLHRVAKRWEKYGLILDLANPYPTVDFMDGGTFSYEFID